mmetsp:Transcript_46418/g.109022  ORF Transcript_46418/g.109022 Transcript_46418/m.109022 type:complete len:457 (+) Transcript_46418:1808-3178(+)
MVEAVDSILVQSPLRTTDPQLNLIISFLADEAERTRLAFPVGRVNDVLKLRSALVALLNTMRESSRRSPLHRVDTLISGRAGLELEEAIRGIPDPRSDSARVVRAGLVPKGESARTIRAHGSDWAREALNGGGGLNSVHPRIAGATVDRGHAGAAGEGVARARQARSNRGCAGVGGVGVGRARRARRRGRHVLVRACAAAGARNTHLVRALLAQATRLALLALGDVVYRVPRRAAGQDPHSVFGHPRRAGNNGENRGISKALQSRRAPLAGVGVRVHDVLRWREACETLLSVVAEDSRRGSFGGIHQRRARRATDKHEPTVLANHPVADSSCRIRGRAVAECAASARQFCTSRARNTLVTLLRDLRPCKVLVRGALAGLGVAVADAGRLRREGAVGALGDVDRAGRLSVGASGARGACVRPDAILVVAGRARRANHADRELARLTETAHPALLQGS